MFDLKKALIPYPQHVEEYGKNIVIGHLAQPEFTFSAEGNDSDIFFEAKKLIEKSFCDIAAINNYPKNALYQIILKIDNSDERFIGHTKNNTYYIDIKSDKAMLCATDEGGAYYAAVTFSQMLYADKDKVTIPQVYIFDYPDFEHRGHYIECRYGMSFMTKQNWFDMLDYFSLLKLNRITIGVHGCWSDQYDGKPAQFLYVPIKKYPQLQTPLDIKYFSVKENKWIYKKNELPLMFREDFFGEIIAYGKKKNIRVQPLFNSLGHNRLLPTVFPEISSVNEEGKPSGYGFCTKNDKVYEIMFNIYDEIIERYLKPNNIDSIEIGLDEVGKNYICHCKRCNAVEHSKLMLDYIIKICKFLKSRGMKHIYIFHDMLFIKFNMINEQLKELLIKEDIYDVVVLDWWSYEDPKKLFYGKTAGVNNIMRSIIKPFTGYYNWVIPTENNDNIKACALLAHEKGFEGIEAYGTYAQLYDKNYLCLSEAAWNTSALDDEAFDDRYAAFRFGYGDLKAQKALQYLHEIMIDETGKDYSNRACFKLEYYPYSYRKDNLPYPQNFPGDVFRLISENEAEYLGYLKMLLAKSQAAISLLYDCKYIGKYKDECLLTAKHYNTMASEYLNLYSMAQKYNDCLLDEYSVISELDTMICEREKLMHFAELVRSKNLQYTYLRNMTIFRQFLIDLRDYFKAETKLEKRPKLDLIDLNYTKSSIYDFLK